MSSELLLLNMVQACAENPLCDSIATPCLTKLDGQQIVSGSPLGVEGAIRTVFLTREALRRAGRPGMPIVNGIATGTKAQEHIAGHRFGIRNTDSLEIGTVHEMKVDLDSLNKIAYSLAAGSLIFGENGVILGGLAGGPAGTAVVTAAYNPVDQLILRAAVQHPFPTHYDLGTNSTRDTIWARSLATQAVTRHSPLPIVNVGHSAAGPMTEMHFHEFSAWIIGSVASGSSIEVGPSGKGTAIDYTSPMASFLGTGVAHSVVGMSRKEASAIVDTLLNEYEEQLPNPPRGQKYQECFDIVTGKPNKQFVTLYREIKGKMADRFGLKFPHNMPYL